jgi:hypothetical protein
MKGDFTRTTFDSSKHFSRVLIQQGRVQLDADWNEQTSILFHYLRTLATDLAGPHWGPKDNLGFEISNNEEGSFNVGPGHYYVKGILCENEQTTDYRDQPGYPFPDDPIPGSGSRDKYLVYLDVWEQPVTYIEDSRIREVALGGPDTALRAKVIWQVRLKRVGTNGISAGNAKNVYDNFLKELEEEHQPGTGLLKARAGGTAPTNIDTACIIPPEARYRGPENQLYRVEIHEGSPANQVTFKWSRDNAGMVYPIRSMAGNRATLEHLGRDEHSSLHIGDYVEIEDDDYVLGGHPRPLGKVIDVNRVDMQVTLELPKGKGFSYEEDSAIHPRLRRWDSDLAPVKEGTGAGFWLELEDGIQIQFQPPDEGADDHYYQRGDYWLIPARTVTGNIEWPQIEDAQGQLGPEARPPAGVKHYYAPLWIIWISSEGVEDVQANDCRRKLSQLWE